MPDTTRAQSVPLVWPLVGLLLFLMVSGSALIPRLLDGSDRTLGYGALIVVELALVVVIGLVLRRSRR